MNNAPTPQYDNSAARLLSIIKKAQQTSRDNATTQVFFCKALGIGKDNLVNFHRTWAEVLKLLDNVEAEIKLLSQPDALDFYAEMLRGLKREFDLLTSKLYTPSTSYNTNIVDRKWTAFIKLEGCVRELRQESIVSGYLEEDSLDELAGELNSLIESVRASVLSPEFKEMLLRKLLAIKRAIEDYQILGVPGIIEAYESAVGGIVENGNLVRPSYENEANREVIEETGKFFKKLRDSIKDNATTFNAAVLAAQTVKEPVLQLLGYCIAHAPHLLLPSAPPGI